MVLGRAFEAMRSPKIRAKLVSRITNCVERLLTFPYALSSVFKCGFQCGTLSNTKWLPRASGMARAGFTTLVAIAAPTTTCGVSSTI